ncbi:General secretion pathway protein E [Candidatus Burkholderia verschuerenii]|uniref:General secretion pathway protein E n=2 Tax=Candidatus Burkholderia verschuerenii TaxID=242163 RepID=A0A0L0M575_9BURK|nr:General secretion pathway protein E [Candidatus Burkholderia verschuerenii]
MSGAYVLYDYQGTIYTARQGSRLLNGWTVALVAGFEVNLADGKRKWTETISAPVDTPVAFSDSPSVRAITDLGSPLQPVLKRSSRQRARAEAKVRPEQRDDVSRTRAMNPQVSFLGRALSGGDVEDVESTEVEKGGSIGSDSNAFTGGQDDYRSVVKDGDQASAGVTTVETNHEPEFRPFVPPKFDRPSYDRMAAAMAAAEEHDTSPDSAPVVEQPVHSVHSADPRLGSVTPVSRAADAQQAGAERSDESPTSEISQPLRRADAPNASADDVIDDDTALDALMPGRPELISVDSLPEFKRILTVADDDAALRIPVSARKEFVAVELQPGVAITVATSRFAEKAQYATFVKDLGSNDILVREEMIATEKVIAAIYSGKSASSANSVVREASRAIGNFRDIVEAAHSFGASDIHFEPREFHNDGCALFAAYSDLVQRNTNSGNSFQPSSPQSAMIPLVVKTDTVNLRWQSSPLVGGYDVTLRSLDGNFKNYSVLLPKDMGLEKSQLDLIDTLNYVSGGITALTSETDSGKTTTLRELSYMLPDRELKKQFAVNEPSEYPMPWLSDYSIIRRPVETDDEANRKYAEVIRTLMRQDPDDLTIGEVRDRVVMGLVAELALTGHPVRFSLHAGDIIAAVMRMAGGRLQLPIDELASEGFINAVGNQKLIPTLCEHCKLPAEDVMAASDLEILRTKFGLDTSRMATTAVNTVVSKVCSHDTVRPRAAPNAPRLPPNCTVRPRNFSNVWPSAIGLVRAACGAGNVEPGSITRI